jgi:tetratricopeptide (TPR) repeat protein
MTEGKVTTGIDRHSDEPGNRADELARHYHALVDALRGISEAYLYEARLDDALRLLNSDLLGTIQEELMPQDRVRLQFQRARIMRHKCSLKNRGNDAELEILSAAEKEARSLNDKRLLADIVDLVGEVIYCKELWHTTLDTPLEHFEQALALRKEIDDRKGIAASLLHVGYVYQHKTGADEEDAQKAFECFQEAYRLAEEGNYVLERAEAARHMAAMYGRKGEQDKALSYHMEFATMSEEVGFKLYLPPGYVMVGVSYLAKGELDKALEYCQRARALATGMGANWFLAESLFGIGAVQEARKDMDAALSYYHQALTTAQSVNFGLIVELATKKIAEL